MATTVRKGQGDVKLTREEFEHRLRERFFDPAFRNVERQIADIVDVAWKTYDDYHKSPRTRKAGPGFADPEHELPIEMNELYPRWVAAHGVMIVTPVYWYQAPSVLKLMMDRLVCADGGNPDQTTASSRSSSMASRSAPRRCGGRSPTG